MLFFFLSVHSQIQRPNRSKAPHRSLTAFNVKRAVLCVHRVIVKIKFAVGGNKQPINNRNNRKFKDF